MCRDAAPPKILPKPPSSPTKQSRLDESWDGVQILVPSESLITVGRRARSRRAPLRQQAIGEARGPPSRSRASELQSGQASESCTGIQVAAGQPACTFKRSTATSGCRSYDLGPEVCEPDPGPARSRQADAAHHRRRSLAAAGGHARI